MTHKAKMTPPGLVDGYGHDRSWNPELSEHFIQCFESDGFDQARFC